MAGEIGKGNAAKWLKIRAEGERIREAVKQLENNRELQDLLFKVRNMRQQQKTAAIDQLITLTPRAEELINNLIISTPTEGKLIDK